MTPSTLTCKECGHVNESERIYCHNCGVKLDRSILPPEETLEETQEQVRKRVTAVVNPKSGFWAGSWKSALQSIGSALVVATLVQICRPPDNVPPLPKKGEIIEKPMIPMLLSRAMAEPTPQRIAIQEGIANSYLLASIKSAQSGLIGDELKFLRIYAEFRPGVCSIICQHSMSIVDFSFFTRVSYRLQVADKKVNAVCVGGSLGRMPIHPLIMQYADLAFESTWKALDHEHKQLDQMQAIELKDKEIVLETKPGGRF
jgi:hypothetical protein